MLTDDEYLAYKVLTRIRTASCPTRARPSTPIDRCAVKLPHDGVPSRDSSAQLPYIAGHADIRNENALHLSALLQEIPGVYPQRVYDGGRSAWHLYMFRIDEEEFGLSRDELIQAIHREGISCGTGYRSCDWMGYVRKSLDTRAGRRVYSKRRLDEWTEITALPNFHKIAEETIWIFQSHLLAPKENMDVIADVVRRIHKYAPEVKKALA